MQVGMHNHWGKMLIKIYTHPSVDAVTIATRPSSREEALVVEYILLTDCADLTRVDDVGPNNLRRI